MISCFPVCLLVYFVFKPKQKLSMVAHTCSSLDLCSSAQDGGEGNMRPMCGMSVHEKRLASLLSDHILSFFLLLASEVWFSPLHQIQTSFSSHMGGTENRPVFLGLRTMSWHRPQDVRQGAQDQLGYGDSEMTHGHGLHCCEGQVSPLLSRGCRTFPQLEGLTGVTEARGGSEGFL